MTETDLEKVFREYRQKQLEEWQERTRIFGYCACCGAPNIDGVQDHDVECIWYDDGK